MTPMRVGPLRHRRLLGALVGVLAIGCMGVGLLLTAGPAMAAERGPILFQPVTDKEGTFVGVGTGPFTTKFPDGVKDDGKTLDRSKVVADNFDKPYTWGSSGSDGGMVIKNISGKPICELTVRTLDDTTFPKDTAKYQAPEGWEVTVSDDGKKLTVKAKKKPDNCVAHGAWFWMKAPASPKPTEKGGATLEGQLALADGDTDAVAAMSIRPDGPETPTSTTIPPPRIDPTSTVSAGVTASTDPVETMPATRSPTIGP
jgi:hypothetical protein